MICYYDLCYVCVVIHVGIFDLCFDMCFDLHCDICSLCSDLHYFMLTTSVMPCVVISSRVLCLDVRY